ncbi:hypothetical protein JRQ81_003627 [Phrynocephalus forsythii]|uniref:Uncharacterized protein n=1 Tax=Phrynocephalus forsythii TaxID=171643 RepID=A0A9Q0XL69_9SAUR|nr:hypothetical protein JRQ81_003627 [Phrynocephalus forsythii]
MELAAVNKTCWTQSYWAKHLKGSQRCERDQYTLKPSCSERWMLETDDMDSFQPLVVYSNSHEIWRLQRNNGDYSAIVSGLCHFFAMDFQLKQNSFDCTEVVEDKIYQITWTSLEVVIQYILATPEGVVMEWITSSIHWVEEQIEVVNMNRALRRILLAGDIEHLWAVALDPQCSNIQDEVPVVDMNKKLSFWNEYVDSRAHSYTEPLTAPMNPLQSPLPGHCISPTHMSPPSTSHHTEVLQEHEYLSHHSAVSLYGGEVYWTDWRTNTLAKANKWTGHIVMVVQRTNTQPFDLQVYHPSCQLQGEMGHGGGRAGERARLPYRVFCEGAGPVAPLALEDRGALIGGEEEPVEEAARELPPGTYKAEVRDFNARIGQNDEALCHRFGEHAPEMEMGHLIHDRQSKDQEAVLDRLRQHST